MFISLWALFREHAEIVGLALFNGFPLALSPGFSTMGEWRVSTASSLGFRLDGGDTGNRCQGRLGAI